MFYLSVIHLFFTSSLSLSLSSARAHLHRSTITLFWIGCAHINVVHTSIGHGKRKKYTREKSHRLCKKEIIMNRHNILCIQLTDMYNSGDGELSLRHRELKLKFWCVGLVLVGKTFYSLQFCLIFNTNPITFNYFSSNAMLRHIFYVAWNKRKNHVGTLYCNINAVMLLHRRKKK